MTEKYTWDVCDGDALFYEDGAVIDYDDVVELLNKLHEENESMKDEINHCHRIIQTLVDQKGVTDYMDLINLCDRDILIDNGWEYD